MSTELIMLISMIILVVTITNGVPMPLVFAGSIIWIVLMKGLDPRIISTVGYASMSSYVLLAIPLFIIGGVLMARSRIGVCIIDWFDCFFGRIRGSMVFITTCAFGVFSAISGSGMAILGCLAPILYPRMIEKGYPKYPVAAMLACVTPLGLLFPPSITQVLFAWAANISVLTCFLSIIAPGAMVAVLIAITSFVLVRRNSPDIVVTEKLEFPEWRKRTLKTTAVTLPGLIMPVIILGGIYSGVMTITESAAVAAVYALLIAVFLYKDIKFRDIPRVMSDAGVTSGLIMFGIFFIIPLSRLLLQEGVPQMLLNALLSISDERWVILMMINIFMIVFGMFLDDTCGVLIVATLITPVMRGIGISPYQFNAIVGVNFGFGLCTPPTAPFVFFTSRLTGVEVGGMFKYIFIIILCAYIPTLIVTTYVPGFALWIPQMVMGDKFSMF